MIAALQDSVTRLEAANATAYEAGYQDLSQRYITELKKPRISLGSVIGLIGAAGIGVVIGRGIP